MSFQLPATTTTAAAPPAFSFGLTTPAGGATAKPTSFTFGSTGGGDAGSAKPPTLGLGTTPASTTAAPAATANTGGGFFAQPTALPTFGAVAAQAPTLTATTTVSSVPSLSFGATPLATPIAPAAATSAAPATLTLSKTTAPPTGLGTTTSTPLQLTTTTAAQAPAIPPATTATGFASLSTATKTTDSSTVATAAQLSYNQLEEHINKWTLELEEQEKVFTDQATQINAWDKILISNNQKILELNDAVQKVKSDQHTLEQELEFIATQHKELEESITPLQKEFMKIPQVDMERSQTYLMVENLDTQLKQMSEDLKEIIDNLNEANKGQDNSDPIIQIGKILNAHMSSLQWIESSSNNIGNKLEEITKMHESFKRDSERSFRSAYYN